MLLLSLLLRGQKLSLLLGGRLLLRGEQLLRMLLLQRLLLALAHATGLRRWPHRRGRRRRTAVLRPVLRARTEIGRWPVRRGLWRRRGDRRRRTAPGWLRGLPVALGVGLIVEGLIHLHRPDQPQ